MTDENNQENPEEHSSPIQFPCDFVVKVMGKAHDEFEKTVYTIIKKHFPDIADNSIKQRHSKDRNYLALSITVHAESKQQLDSLYQDLSSNNQIIMAL